MDRATYRFTAPTLWVYTDGVYVREQGQIRQECQALLRTEWTTTRVAETITYVQDATRVNDWHEEHPRYLNLQNGLFDLETGQLVPHTPAHFSTVQLPITYDPAAQCPTILAWFDEVTGQDAETIDTLRAYLKAIVKGETRIQRLLELIGPGGGGKGTFMRLAQALVGRANTAVTELRHLEGNRFELATVRFKRLICVTD